MAADRGAVTVSRSLLVVVLGVAAVALAVLAGLRTGGGPRGCTQVGSPPSHVSVAVEGAGWTVARLCVDGECHDADRVEVSSDPGVHPFRASLVDAHGRTVERSGEVTTVEVWPNGEGCGRRRAYGRVSIGANGTVTTQDPRDDWSDPNPGPTGETAR